MELVPAISTGTGVVRSPGVEQLRTETTPVAAFDPTRRIRTRRRTQGRLVFPHANGERPNLRIRAKTVWNETKLVKPRVVERLPVGLLADG